MAQINSKEIQKSLQDDVNARKDGIEKVKKLSDEVEKAKDNLKESNFELEKQTMQRDRAFAAGEDTLKLDESINKQKKKIAKEQLTLDQTAVLKDDFAAKYQQESIQVLNKIGDNVLKVSPEEMELRKAFQESISVEKEQLKMLEADPLRQDQAEALKKNIEAKEKKEKTRQERAQALTLSNGFRMLSDNFKSFGESMESKALPFLKTGLLIAAYFAFAKLLQSEALMDFVKFFGEQGGFTKTLIVLGGIIASFIAYTGLKMALLKFLGGLTFIKNDLMKTGGAYRNSGGKIMGGLKKGGMRLFGGVKNLGIAMGKNAALLGGKTLSGLSVGASKLGTAAVGLKSSIMGIGPKLLVFGKFLLGSVVKGLALINPIALIGAAIAGIGLLIYNYWDEIKGFFGSIADKIMSATSDLRAKIGNYFSNLFKPVTDLIKKIKNYLAGIYNDVANSFIGKKLGMKPMAIESDSENMAKASEIMSGGEKDPARFIARKQNEDMQMRRKEEMMDEKRAVNNINNQTVVNNVSSGGTTVQNNATRYVKDQGSVFASNNA